MAVEGGKETLGTVRSGNSMKSKASHVPAVRGLDPNPAPVAKDNQSELISHRSCPGFLKISRCNVEIFSVLIFKTFIYSFVSKIFDEECCDRSPRHWSQMDSDIIRSQEFPRLWYLWRITSCQPGIISIIDMLMVFLCQNIFSKVFFMSKYSAAWAKVNYVPDHFQCLDSFI